MFVGASFVAITSVMAGALAGTSRAAVFAGDASRRAIFATTLAFEPGIMQFMSNQCDKWRMDSTSFPRIQSSMASDAPKAEVCVKPVVNSVPAHWLHFILFTEAPEPEFQNLVVRNPLRRIWTLFD